MSIRIELNNNKTLIQLEDQAMCSIVTPYAVICWDRTNNKNDIDIDTESGKQANVNFAGSSKLVIEVEDIDD